MADISIDVQSLGDNASELEAAAVLKSRSLDKDSTTLTAVRNARIAYAKSQSLNKTLNENMKELSADISKFEKALEDVNQNAETAIEG